MPFITAPQPFHNKCVTCMSVFYLQNVTEVSLDEVNSNKHTIVFFILLVYQYYYYFVPLLQR